MLSRKIFLLSLVIVFLATGASCINFSGQSKGSVGMYRSSDKGEKWSSIVAFPTIQGVKSLSGLKVYIVVNDPSDVNTKYIGSRGQGMYYTNDNGASWRDVPVLANKFIYAITIDPKDKCNIYVSDGANIYKSEDCTRSWNMIFSEERTGQRISDLAVDFNNSKVIYASQQNGDILRSTDSGVSWRVIKRFGFSIKNIAVSPLVTGKTRIYAASYDQGLYRSDDGGDNWTILKDGFDEYSQSLTYYRIMLHPSKANSLYWISKYGILLSDDAGKSWNQINLLTPPGSVQIYSFTVNPANTKELYYTGTVLNEKKQNVKSTFYKSSDGGNNWVTRKLPSNTVPVYMSVHPTNSSMIFLGFTLLDN